ncbi:MAG: hypothetical protein AABY64_09835 [Bdellovibrionota bacterium]
MKKSVTMSAVLLFVNLSYGYTTLDCVAAYQNPVVNTQFHIPLTLRVKNNQIKRIDRLNKTDCILAYQGLDKSRSRKIYASNHNSGIYLGIINRNWEPGQILLGEQLYVIEGRVIAGVAQRPHSTLDCKTVPTLKPF